MNDNEIKKLIGTNIRIFRKLNNMTLDDLSEKLGCKNTSLSYYERGVQAISAINLYKISKILNVPIEKFYKKNTTI